MPGAYRIVLRTRAKGLLTWTIFVATKHSIAGIKGIRLRVWFFLASACWTILIVGICLFDFCVDYATDCEMAQVTISKGLGKDLLDPQWTPYQKSIDKQRQTLVKSYSTIWVVGMAGISLFLYRIKVYLANLKLAKHAIGEYELLERALMASLPIGIAVIDPKTRVIERINGYGAGLFGAPAEQIAGHRCHKFLSRR
jgi:PAS domain-containing protein